MTTKILLKVTGSETEYIKESFKHLFQSLDNTNTDYTYGEKLTNQITAMERDKEAMVSQIDSLQSELSLSLIERENLRFEIKQMSDAYMGLTRQKDLQHQALSQRILDLTEEGARAKQTLGTFVAKCNKLDAHYKGMIKQRDRLRVKLIRLQKNRFAAKEVATKTCKNCNQEYQEKENFNWSCRTHQSEWGGRVWWCCGKESKNHPGCKFQKHISKDNDQDDEDDRPEESKPVDALARCQCCKLPGHSADQCPQDPNLRTHAKSLTEDFKRILSATQTSKKQIEAAVNTTQFLKKAVMVPTETSQRTRSQPFSRGIMHFDDFNYRAYN